MSKVVALQTLNLLSLAAHGNHAITDSTQYLSTLPHPVEPVEELIAVVAVITSLLNTLHHTIDRFSVLKLSPTASFLAPLSHDIFRVIGLLAARIAEAQRMKIFEPSPTGLVRVPRAAWNAVCGGENGARALRSRLYVEKYRVRVLIETVAWVGLTRMGPEARTEIEEREFRHLGKMLPLVVERLVGLQMDYVPRLRKAAGKEPWVAEEKVVAVEQRKMVSAPTQEDSKESWAEKPLKADLEKHALFSSKSCSSLTSTRSSSSSITIASPTSDLIHESYVLRVQPATKALQSSITVFGLPITRSYKHTPPSYYIKPLLASEAEMQALCESSAAPAVFHKEILKLPEQAQWEIQRLVETRDAACSSQEVKRAFEVVAWRSCPRRKIQKAGKRGGGGKEHLVEYVFVLKGGTVDEEKRCMPRKHEDAWAPKMAEAQARAPESVTPCPGPSAASQQRQQQQQQIGMVGTPVLCHVESRRLISLEEAEKRMEAVERELFVPASSPASPIISSPSSTSIADVSADASAASEASSRYDCADCPDCNESKS